jgi:hypothetical protein
MLEGELYLYLLHTLAHAQFGILHALLFFFYE